MEETAEDILKRATHGRFNGYIENREAIHEEVLRCGASGYSKAQIAACLGVSKETLRLWAKKFETFRAVLERADTMSQSWWEGKAMTGFANAVIGGTVWNKSMSARFPEDYTERKEEGPLGEAARVNEVRWSVVDPPKREE